MRWGIIVLSFFAALWGVAAIMIGHLPPLLAVLPIALSCALLLWARRQTIGTGSPIVGDHVRRVVVIATTLEFIAILVIQEILTDLHLQTALMPSAAIIVGLHFFPLARWIPVPFYYRTGGALLAVGLAALLLPPSARGVTTGMGAALVLWLSAVMLVRRGRG